MGRHSAPGDDSDDVVDGGVDDAAVLTDDSPQGRHSHGGPDADGSDADGPDADGPDGARPRPGTEPAATESTGPVLDDSAPTQVIAPPLEVLDAPTGPVGIGSPRPVTWAVPTPTDDGGLLAQPDVDAATAPDDLLPGGFASEQAPAAVATQQTEARPAKRRSGGDLALLRSHGDVRARCLAGLLVPFVLYFAAQIVLGGSGRQMLLFVFIPLIVAGVLVGAFLDAGHKRHDDAVETADATADPDRPRPEGRPQSVGDPEPAPQPPADTPQPDERSPQTTA